MKRYTPRAVWLLLLASAVLCLTRPAAACPESSVSWAKQCASLGDFRFGLLSCPSGVLIASAQIGDGAALSVELGEAKPGSFRRSGSLGIQPIGEYPDWGAEPETRRAALDRVVACVDKLGAPQLPTPTSLARPKPPTERLPSPRLLLLGLGLVGVALLGRVALGRRAVGPQALRSALAVSVLTAACGALRWWLVGAAPYHQNGQGPLWIAKAALVSTSPPIYGPGYAETLSWLLQSGEPDRRVYLAMSLLLALAVPVAYCLTRLAGSSRPLSFGIAALVAAHPLLARLAGSESYYAVILGLSTLAALGLALAAAAAKQARNDRRQAYLFVAGCLGAGCLVAQAARVHPIGWVAMATLPLVMLQAPAASLRKRFLVAIIGGGLVGAIVLLTSGAAMHQVLTGELGQQWLPQSRFRLNALGYMLLALPLFLVSQRRPQDLIGPVSFGLCVTLAVGANSTGANFPRISHSYFFLYLPALISSFAASLNQIKTPKLRAAVAACVLAAGAVVSAPQFAHYLSKPTDVLEAELMASWREALPAGSNLLYVERIGARVSMLPLYRREKIRPFTLSDDSEAVPAAVAAPAVYYYRSSLCSTPEGQPVCSRIEGQLKLKQLKRAELEPLPSHPWQPVGESPIGVVLYQVEGVAQR